MSKTSFEVLAAVLGVVSAALGVWGVRTTTERNDLQGTVSSLERQLDDAHGENDALNDEVAELRDQLDRPSVTTTSTTTASTPTTLGVSGNHPEAYPARTMTITSGRCGYGTSFVDLDAPQADAESTVAEFDYTICGGTGIPPAFVFSSGVRVAESTAPDAAGCAEAISLSSIGGEVEIVPTQGKVLCVETSSSEATTRRHPQHIVRLEVLTVTGPGSTIEDHSVASVQVEAWNS